MPEQQTMNGTATDQAATSTQAEAAEEHRAPQGTAALLISAKEFAELLGVGESTFFRLVAKGEVGPAPIRLGSRRLYNRDEVRAWIANPVNGRLADRKTWQAIRETRLNLTRS